MRSHDKFTPRGIFAPRGKFAPKGKLMHINGTLDIPRFYVTFFSRTVSYKSYKHQLDRGLL